MKFLKNILAIIILCTISSISAKQMGTKPVSTGGTVTKPAGTTVTKPVTKTEQQVPVQPRKPIQAPKTFPQLVAEVKNAQKNTVWDDKNKLLKITFIDKCIQDSITAGLDKEQLNVLLVIARDFHVQFTGDVAKDIEILKNLATQRSDALRDLAKLEEAIYYVGRS